MMDDVNAKLRRGEVVVVGSGIYQMCAQCQSIIRVNKPIFGSLHFCDARDEAEKSLR